MITLLVHKRLKRKKKILVSRDMLIRVLLKVVLRVENKNALWMKLKNFQVENFQVFSYLWTESTSWPHWWSLHQRNPRSSIPCASSCERKSRSLPTVSTHKSTGAPKIHTQRQRSRSRDIWMVGILNIHTPSGIFCHPPWRSKWSCLESAGLSTCRRGNWLPRLLRGGWLTGQSCSSASILWWPKSLVQPVERNKRGMFRAFL